MKKFKKFIIYFILFLGIGFSFSTTILAAPDPGTANLARGANGTSGNPDAGTVNLADGTELKDRMGNPTQTIEIKDHLGVNSGEEIDGEGGILMKIVKFARESIFNLLWVIVVGVLLYIGFKLIIGKGTPDVFKKAIMGFIYLVIGVIIIYTAWAMVKIILGVNFS